MPMESLSGSGYKMLLGLGLAASITHLVFNRRDKKEEAKPPCFHFDVKGQKGDIPMIGLGTATMNHQVCIDAIRQAIDVGYRHIDTALLYNNQEAVGEAIRQAIEAGDVKREDLWVTSKVGFYPGTADGKNTWIPIAFHECNRKGKQPTARAIDLCLQKLQLKYVDLMLIHNPATNLDEYQASGCPHFFELSGSQLTSEEREMVLQSRLKKVEEYDKVKSEASRAATWKALEEAKDAGKCRFIGVSNYPTQLLEDMKEYARVMPCVNQLELHPRFSSPTLQATANKMGVILTGYGTGNSVKIGGPGKSVIEEIARRLHTSSVYVVLRWMLQKGIVGIPRSANPEHMRENLATAMKGAIMLSDDDIAAIDELNEAHPYYWSPLPLLPPGTLPDRS